MKYTTKRGKLKKKKNLTLKIRILLQVITKVKILTFLEYVTEYFNRLSLTLLTRSSNSEYYEMAVSYAPLCEVISCELADIRSPELLNRDLLLTLRKYSACEIT